VRPSCGLRTYTHMQLMVPVCRIAGHQSTSWVQKTLLTFFSFNETLVFSASTALAFVIVVLFCFLILPLIYIPGGAAGGGKPLAFMWYETDDPKRILVSLAPMSDTHTRAAQLAGVCH
jgi:hypothetical protein